MHMHFAVSSIVVRFFELLTVLVHIVWFCWYVYVICWEDRLRNDRYFVEWDVKRYNLSLFA